MTARGTMADLKVRQALSHASDPARMVARYSTASGKQASVRLLPDDAALCCVGRASLPIAYDPARLAPSWHTRGSRRRS